MNSEITYYTRTPLRGGSAYAVLRYFSKESKLPEKYVLGSGWMEDHRLLGLLMMGELGPADIVTEAQAHEIIKKLQNNSSHSA